MAPASDSAPISGLQHQPGTMRAPAWAAALLAGLLATLLAIALFWPPPAWGAAAAETDSLRRGAQLFEAHCVGCHVNGGNIIRRGKTLRLQALERRGLADPQAIARVAAEGIGSMSGYGTVLGEGGAEDVAGWVWQQAQAGWPRS